MKKRGPKRTTLNRKEFNKFVKKEMSKHYIKGYKDGVNKTTELFKKNFQEVIENLKINRRKNE